MADNDWSAHPTAVVDDGAVIGAGTKIWHFSHISSGSTIGAGCVFGQNTYVAPGVVIGDDVRVQNNVSIYTGVELEDRVFLGPSCVLTNVVNPRSHVARKDEFRPTRIRMGATVGANATIVCGVEVGRYAFVAAGAVVTRDVAPFVQVVGSPARAVGYRCQCGEKLAHDSPDRDRPDPERRDTDTLVECAACGSRYLVSGGGVEWVNEPEP